ncbi:MAG: tetratricopeptide repeat protein, partial [Kiloniellales bacterium]|nr:tetratricopeptide repeat protein [Kiloniellales bacterium]
MRGHKLFLAITFACQISASACDGVLEAAHEADNDLQEFFGTDASEGLQAPEDRNLRNPRKEVGADAYAKATVLAEEDKEKEAIRELRVAAAQGHAAAAYELGQAHTLGVVVEKDLKAAKRWFTRAAELGDGRALFMIGANYASGNGVPQDMEAAAYYYGEAAIRGHPEAQFQLAEAFAKGNGVPKDLSWAMRWYG